MHKKATPISRGILLHTPGAFFFVFMVLYLMTPNESLIYRRRIWPILGILLYEFFLSGTFRPLTGQGLLDRGTRLFEHFSSCPVIFVPLYWPVDFKSFDIRLFQSCRIVKGCSVDNG